MIIKKLEDIDEILSRYEDWMHGKDGKDCTQARALISEVVKEIESSKIQQRTDIKQAIKKQTP